LSTFVRLVEYAASGEKEIEFNNVENRYFIPNNKYFSNIPGNSIGYWFNEKLIKLFNNKKLGDFGEPRQGLSTSDNDRFLKLWFEVSLIKIGFSINSREKAKISKKKWFPFNKGGGFKKWYGNQEYIINWENDGEELREWADYLNKVGTSMGRLVSKEYYFQEGITFSLTNTRGFGARLTPKGFIFDVQGSTIFCNNNTTLLEMCSFLNTRIVRKMMEVLCPTMVSHVGYIRKLPFINSNNDTITKLTSKSIEISQDYWDSRETSWDFKTNPLIKQKTESGRLSDAYENYCEYWKEKFFQLHKNEEELNKIFIEIYDLGDELTPEVPLEEVTILKEETAIQKDELIFKNEVIIKQFLSYAIGCLLGRYSPDIEGLILANQGETLSEFKETIPNPTFIPDEDNIVPVLDDEYFEDDIIARFKEFLKNTFGMQMLYENLEFIAEALDKRSNETAEQTIRRYFMNDFYCDHCKIYKKRPIYWLFTSGPEKAFNALIYIHRYNKETLAKMRIDYLIKLEEKLEAKKATLKTDSSDPKIKQKALNEQTKINKKLVEIRSYDERLKHLADQYIEIDLDDGVKKNYELFEEIAAEI
jgi:hypothetical protein